MRWFQNGYICHGWGGSIVMFLFWALLIIGIIWIVRKNDLHQSKADKNKAEEIARSRYAEGEIDKDELNNILKNLRE